MITKNYYIFVLGYDLLHDILNGLECDVSYDICTEVYEDFVDSPYNNIHYSEYTCLYEYVEAHMNEIKAKVEAFK